MAISYNSLVSAKTMYRKTLLSGTSWTVPAGVNYINVTLYGAGGGGQGVTGASSGTSGGSGGTTTFTGATSASGGAGATVVDASGALDGGRGALTQGGLGGSTLQSNAGYIIGTMGGSGDVVTSIVTTTPGASITYAIGSGGSGSSALYGAAGGTGGNGKIDIEYWA